MDKKLDTLYDLCEVVSKELEAANDKIKHTGGDISAGDLEYLDKLTHTMKSIKEIIVMIEDDSMTGDSGYRYMEEGRSRANMRSGRPTVRMERYTRGGGYSRDNARDEFVDEVEELMEKAPDEHTRKKFERLLSVMK